MSEPTQTTGFEAKSGGLAVLQVRLVEHKGVFWKIKIGGASTSHLWVHQDDLQIVNEVPLWQRCK